MTRGACFVGFFFYALVGCTVTAYQPTQQQQTAGGGSSSSSGSSSGGSSSGGSSPAPSTPAPSPTPTQTPTADMAHAPAPPDMATTTSAACKALSDCCAQIMDPNIQQQCMDKVGQLDDAVCMNILQQLQDAGVCM